MLEYELLSPATQKKVDCLIEVNGWTFDQAIEEIVIEGIAMGMRPGITPCVIKPAATYAEATAQFRSPAASAAA